MGSLLGCLFFITSCTSSAANASGDDIARTSAMDHAIMLLEKHEKTTQTHPFSKLTWMNEDARMKESTCAVRYKNGLDNKEEMEQCLELWKNMPDFWKAEFTAKTKTYPKERCIFTFNNDKKPVPYHSAGCGYNK